jgi:hypothetical protein
MIAAGEVARDAAGTDECRLTIQKPTNDATFFSSRGVYA